MIKIADAGITATVAVIPCGLLDRVDITDKKSICRNSCGK